MSGHNISPRTGAGSRIRSCEDVPARFCRYARCTLRRFCTIGSFWDPCQAHRSLHRLTRRAGAPRRDLRQERPSSVRRAGGELIGSVLKDALVPDLATPLLRAGDVYWLLSLISVLMFFLWPSILASLRMARTTTRVVVDRSLLPSQEDAASHPLTGNFHQLDDVVQHPGLGVRCAGTRSSSSRWLRTSIACRRFDHLQFWCPKSGFFRSSAAVFKISRERASSDTARASDIAPTSALKVRIALDLAARLSLSGSSPTIN